MIDRAATRTNDDWVAELRRAREEHSRPLADSAVDDLRQLLLGALRRALPAGQGSARLDLDDLVQDALVGILEGLDRFRGDSRFTTWAVAIGLRVAFSALRRQRRPLRPLAVEDLAELELDPCSDPSRPSGRRSLSAVLRTAIETALTPRQRSAVLGELDAVPADELAERLRTSTNALYKLHHDARKKLRQALAEAGYRAADVRRELECREDRA